MESWTSTHAYRNRCLNFTEYKCVASNWVCKCSQLVNKVVRIRMDTYDELIGADLTEHHIRHGQVGVSRAISALQPFYPATVDIQDIQHVGSNPGKQGTTITGATLLKANPWRLAIEMCFYRIQQSKNFRVNNPYIKHKYIKMCLNGKQNKNKSAGTGTFVLGWKKKPA